MAKHFAVLGSPISHSKSPAIHRAAYRKLGLDWDYQKFEVTADELAGFLAGAESFSGLSLTMPLKNEAASLAVYRDPIVQITEAANTLIRRDAGWAAYNTDVFGIQMALKPLQLSRDTRVALLGSGATAKSSLVAISKEFPSTSVAILARSRDRAGDLSRFGKSLGLNCVVSERDAASADLTISTLPPGVFDSFIESFSGFKICGALFDVAYSPWPSQAAKRWIDAGLPVAAGIEMLVWQAIAQIRLFKNDSLDAPLENEREIAELMLTEAK